MASPTPPSYAQIKEKIGIRILDDQDGHPVIEAHATRQIQTLEEMLAAAKYDLEEWEVMSSIANVWHQMSSSNGLVPLWQVKATLRRRDLSPAAIGELIRAGFDSLRQALRIPMRKLARSSTGKGIMVEFELPDFHLGKLCWSEETGAGNWDLKIAEKVWKEAIEDLMARAPEAEEAWFVLGNDFYNVDNEMATTTAGTPQDEDGRWQKTFRKGKELVMWAVGRLRMKYPRLKLILIYGNHDHQRAFYLGEVLQEAFQSIPEVEIDNRPLPRKYYEWGATGLGYTHGNGIKTKDLAALCQNEARSIWGRTKRFEMHLGHLHGDIVKTLGGVILRWVPALCPPDSWHSSQGYTMNEKAAMALVYNQTGMSSLIVHYPDPKNFL